MATRILVMNDDQDILDLFRTLLEEAGYEVALYSYAPREVEEVERVQPDLIVLDLMFGYENHGWQLLQKLRMSRSTAHIPIVICTAMTRKEYELESYLNSQGVALVPKPFDIDVFLDTVRQLLDLRRNLPALRKDMFPPAERSSVDGNGASRRRAARDD